jgi:hypothetical protein
VEAAEFFGSLHLGSSIARSHLAKAHIKVVGVWIVAKPVGRIVRDTHRK